MVTSRGLVLLCDDSDSIRALMRVNLELVGFDVEEVTDGEAALARLHSSPRPDVVVIDAVMAPRDGWWAIKAIREDANLSGLPVAMVTASVNVHDKGQAGAAGFDAFVAKPFEPEEFVDVVSALADRDWPAVGQP